MQLGDFRTENRKVFTYYSSDDLGDELKVLVDGDVTESSYPLPGNFGCSVSHLPRQSVRCFTDYFELASDRVEGHGLALTVQLSCLSGRLINGGDNVCEPIAR